MNSLSPQLVFKLAKDHERWSDFAVSDTFQMAALCALQRMQHDLQPAGNAEEAAANYYRIDGARRFLYSLLNIGESSPVTTSKESEALAKQFLSKQKLNPQ